MTAIRASGRPLRLRWLGAAVGVGIAAAVLVGMWASRLVSPAAPPPPSRVVEAGPAHLLMPAAWHPASRAGALPGLDPKRLAVLSAGAATMAVTFGAAEEQSLVPRGLRALVDDPRSLPRVTSLAGRPAWLYRAPDSSGPHPRMDVTVLPTTVGMLAVACTSPAHSSDACASAVSSVSLRGAAALKPTPAVALAAVLPTMLERLDQARVAGRAALDRARTPQAQAERLRSLAGQHLAAAHSLRATFGSSASPLIAALEKSARAYTALGTAASAGSSARFAAARVDLRGAEAGLASTIARVREVARRETAGPPRSSPVAPPSRADRPFVTQPLLVILLLLGSCLAGFLASGPLAKATGKVRRARAHRQAVRRAREVGLL